MSQVIKVLHVVHSMDAGGIETFIMNIYRNIDRKKIQFDFLVNTEKKCFYDDEIKRLGGEIFIIHTPYRPVCTHTYKQELFDFFKMHDNYQIVHCHRNSTSVYALEQAKKCGVKTRIAHSHIADFRLTFRTPIYAWHKLFIKKYATHMFACGELAGKWLYGQKAFKQKEIVVINNGIDCDRFRYSPQKRNEARQFLNVDDAFVIGHVGRFSQQKNHEFLLKLFCRIYEKNSKARLLLLGEGELRPQLEKKCKKSGIASAVIFAGIRANTEDYYNAMDVFVFPSLYEGLGIVAVEAQVCGLPVLVSDAVPEEVVLTKNCYRLPLKVGVNAWADKLNEIGLSYKRKNQVELVKKAGYESKESAKKLQEFYLNQ